eukprot:c16899_g2_i1.p1 GENE.c16899_g2_i1~~c16899_g2_i1.p1  ORF type:complete len:823 (+),score=199.08 c16899_g2_i1:166-2634(+)
MVSNLNFYFILFFSVVWLCVWQVMLEFVGAAIHHHLPLKRYFFAQPSSVSCNIVHQLVRYIEGYFVHTRAVNSWTFDRVFAAVTTLTAFAQGPCEEIQKFLIDETNLVFLCSNVCGSLRVTEPLQQSDDPHSPSPLSHLRTAAINLVRALIEGRDEERYVSRVTEALHVPALVNQMSECYWGWIGRRTNTPENTVTSFLLRSSATRATNLRRSHVGVHHAWHDTKVQELKIDRLLLQEGQAVFVLLAELSEYSQLAARQTKYAWRTCSPPAKSAWTFYNKRTRSVEVLHRGKLAKIFFGLPRICRFLSRETKLGFMNNSSGTVASDNLLALLNATPVFVMDMQHQYQLRNRRTLKKLFSGLEGIKIGVSVLAVTANIIVVSSGITPNGSMHGVSRGLFAVVAFVHAVGAGLVLSLRLVVRVPVVVRQRWNNLAIVFGSADYRRYHSTQMHIPRNTDHQRTFVRDARRNKGDKVKEWFALFVFTGFGRDILEIATRKVSNRLLEAVHKLPFRNRLVFYAVSGLFIITDPLTTYLTAYFILAVLTVFGWELLICLHLVDLILRSENLKNVVKAVVVPLKPLGLTFILGIILVFIFAVYAFVNFSSDFFNGQNTGVTCALDDRDNTIDCFPNTIGGTNKCKDLGTCFGTVLNHGWRSGGGIGDYLIEPNSLGSGRWWHRLVYDMVFFIVVINLLLQLVFGIVIDAFARMRDQRNEQVHAAMNECFICSINRTTFDNKNCSFTQHRKSHHNIWSYVYYIVYLQLSSSQLNGIEHACRQMVEQTSVAWFPIGRTLAFETNVAWHDDALEADDFEEKKMPTEEAAAET